MQRIFLIIVLYFGLVSGANVSAQSYNVESVEISTEKVRIDGEVYYSHTVKTRQTLFSISKAYNVSIDDLYESNPNLKEEGLKKNTIIFIPSKEKKSETIVAEKIIPAKKDVVPVLEVPEEEPDYIIHIVKWYENIYRIAEKYNTTPEAIMELNELKSKRLRSNKTLKIPTDSQSTVSETVEIVQTPIMEEESKESSENTDSLATDQRIYFGKDSINIALALPLNTQNNYGGNANIMDFYSGVLLASKELGESGLNIDLSVFDTIDSTRSVISEIKPEDYDFVIGPISPKDITELLQHASKNSRIISPLDHRVSDLVPFNPQLVQVPTPIDYQYEELINWVKSEKKSTEKLIIISQKTYKTNPIRDSIVANFSRDSIDFSQYSYEILQGRGITGTLKSMMNLEANNNFIVASEDEAFINDVIRNLNLLIHDEYKVSLYAPSKVRSFKTIEVDNMYNINLSTASHYYINYDNKDVQNFVLKYRALYQAEPSQFAFQGYDVLYYFSTLCQKYGKDWPYFIHNEVKEMLQTTFKMSKIKKGSGFYNTGTHKLRYKSGYIIEVVK